MNLYLMSFILIGLFAIEVIYFKIADKYNIIDKPNHRSSHTMITIRGGGVIFSISMLLASFYLGWTYKFFLTGLLFISAVSFADDIKPVSSILRITVHLVSVGLMFFELDMYTQPIALICFALFFVIGSINAINFMDGINGITGIYSLITLTTLLYINRYVVSFTTDGYLIFVIMALVVFNFFNFRKKARCFAGDVGSVSIAFMILFFLLQLIIETNNIGYILLLLVYGLDTAITLMLRYYRKEKLSEAHRTHFYQFLANEFRIPHLAVSTFYAVAQVLVNILLIVLTPVSNLHAFLILVSGVILYLLMRLKLEGAERLFNKTEHYSK